MTIAMLMKNTIKAARWAARVQAGELDELLSQALAEFFLLLR